MVMVMIIEKTSNRSAPPIRVLAPSSVMSSHRKKHRIVAPSPEAGDALARWLAIDAPVIEAGDADAHEQLYRDLLERRP